jgi:hypothetical protein
MKDKYYELIEQAEELTLQWAIGQGIPLYKIDCVVVFEEWSNGIGVYIFFENEEDRLMAQEKGILKEIENYHSGILREMGYPFNKYPEVNYIFDSDENVRKNYEGNYFFRLR